VTSPVDSPWPLSYMLPIVTDPLSTFVSEIFGLKVADTQTNRQAGRQLVRSLLTVCDIDVFVFSCVGHTPLLILIHLGLPLQTSLLLS